MGVISTIHIVEYSEVLPIINDYRSLHRYLERYYVGAETSLESIIETNRKYKDDSNKAWNPTYEFLNSHFITDESLKLTSQKLFTPEMTHQLDTIFKNIDRTRMIELLREPDIVDSIKTNDGYRMESIIYTNLILENLDGIMRIVSKANQESKSILIETE